MIDILQTPLPAAQKNIFVVLGMPRSGTSVVMRGLHALGIEIGDKLVPPNDLWNPTGFWEDQEISHAINCGVLFALDYVWESVSLIDRVRLQDEKLLPLKKLAIQLLTERLQHCSYWGFKDPRTVKILPFWQSVFAEMNLQENYVIALRNPLAVASSLQKLRKYGLETGLLLWLMHLVPAIDETHHKPRLIVSYESLLERPHQQLARIRQHFAIPPTLSHAIKNDIVSFLDKKLAHFGCTTETFLSHPAAQVVPLTKDVYALLLAAAEGDITMQDEAFLKPWRKIKKEFIKLYPLFLYVNDLLNKNKQYERNFRSLKRSFLWKMVGPLHALDDWLRTKRRKKRAIKNKRVSVT